MQLNSIFSYFCLSALTFITNAGFAPKLWILKARLNLTELLQTHRRYSATVSTGLRYIYIEQVQFALQQSYKDYLLFSYFCNHALCVL